jgi:hypothetical protein
MIKYQFDPPAQLLNYGWYVAVKGSDLFYLHQDGEVRKGTARSGDVDGERSGYFATKRDASLAIMRRMDRQEFSE